jgi:peptidoglycan-associated lipoprotein
MFHRSTASWRVYALALLATWTLFGCSRCRRGEEALGTVTPAPVPVATEPGAGEGTPVTERPRVGPTELITELNIIYFDFDRSNLDTEDQNLLEENARWMRQHADLDILIEGHCDERGTDEYNYALGERRANAVLTHLRELGVPNNLYTRSYGETRPAREGHSEEAWRWNRRAQFSRYAD